MSTAPLGRVVATERRPNTPHEFHFWTALDSPVGIGTIVRVDGSNPVNGQIPRVYGIVVEGFSYTDLQSPMHDVLGHEDQAVPEERADRRDVGRGAAEELTRLVVVVVLLLERQQVAVHAGAQVVLDIERRPASERRATSTAALAVPASTMRPTRIHSRSRFWPATASSTTLPVSHGTRRPNACEMTARIPVRISTPRWGAITRRRRRNVARVLAGTKV